MIDQWMGYKRVHVQYIFGQIQLITCYHLMDNSWQFSPLFWAIEVLLQWTGPVSLLPTLAVFLRWQLLALQGATVCVCCLFWAVCVGVCLHVMSCACILYTMHFASLCTIKSNKCVCVCMCACSMCLRVCVCLCACTDLRCSSFGTFENMVPQYPMVYHFPNKK